MAEKPPHKFQLKQGPPIKSKAEENEQYKQKNDLSELQRGLNEDEITAFFAKFYPSHREAATKQEFKSILEGIKEKYGPQELERAISRAVITAVHSGNLYNALENIQLWSPYLSKKRLRKTFYELLDLLPQGDISSMKHLREHIDEKDMQDRVRVQIDYLSIVENSTHYLIAQSKFILETLPKDEALGKIKRVIEAADGKSLLVHSIENENWGFGEEQIIPEELTGSLAKRRAEAMEVLVHEDPHVLLTNAWHLVSFFEKYKVYTESYKKCQKAFTEIANNFDPEISQGFLKNAKFIAPLFGENKIKEKVLKHAHNLADDTLYAITFGHYLLKCTDFLNEKQIEELVKKAVAKNPKAESSIKSYKRFAKYL